MSRLVRATVEQIRDLAGAWEETQVRALAEDWLRQEEALRLVRDWIRYGEGSESEAAEALDAALAGRWP